MQDRAQPVDETEFLLENINMSTDTAGDPVAGLALGARHDLGARGGIAQRVELDLLRVGQFAIGQVDDRHHVRIGHAGRPHLLGPAVDLAQQFERGFLADLAGGLDRGGALLEAAGLCHQATRLNRQLAAVSRALR